MPRTYVRKSLRATCYTPDDVARAIEKVETKELTLFGAAKQYNIPLATLHNRLYKKTGIKSDTLGRAPVFPYEIEVRLANGLKNLEKWGFGLSRKEVIALVARYVRLNNIQTPFKDGVPGPDWFTNFRKRHGLSLKKAQALEHARKQNTDPFIINEYFTLLLKTLEELHLDKRPNQIWNLDETSVCLDPSKTKVVGKKGAPSSRRTHGTGKENITVLTAVSANGSKITPLIIFKGKFVWDTWVAETEGKYDFELSYATSRNGWMDTEIFHNYMKKVFIPALGPDRPVLVIYDGHNSHVDLNVVDLAIKNNITILKLPPHTSHLLQPLDLAVFKSFKSRWDAKLVEWQRQNIKLPKKVFSELFAEIWNDTKDQIIMNGFKKAGIHPFNSEVVPIDKYDPSAYKRWQKVQKNNSGTLQKESQSSSQDDTPQNALPKHVDAQFSEQHSHSQVQSTLDNKTPRSLKKLCIDAVNEQIFDENSLVEDSESVHLLADVYKCKEQTQKFIANQEESLPICLAPDMLTRKEAIPKTDLQAQHTKINIITKEATSKIDLQAQNTKINIITKEATSKTDLQSQNTKINIISNNLVTFEELLLETVKQNPRQNSKIKKRRVALGAEVITETMKKQLEEKTTKSVLKTNIVIPKKKTNMQKENKDTAKKKTKAPKENENMKEKVQSICESSQVKEQVNMNKCEIKKEAHQKRKIHKIIQRKRKLSIHSETESSEDETEVITMDTDDSEYENMDEYIEKILKEQDEDHENVDPCANIPLGLSDITYYDDDPNELKKDDWLVIKFAMKKSVKHFVGTILKFENQMPIVKYARKVKRSKSETVTTFTYPVVEDISTIKHKEDIVCVLPQPIISRRGQITFQIDLNKYNIQ